MQGELPTYRISSIKHCGVCKISKVLGAAFIGEKRLFCSYRSNQKGTANKKSAGSKLN